MLRVILLFATSTLIKDIQCGIVNKHGVDCNIQCDGFEYIACGSDGRTYQSNCNLEVASCLQGHNITFISYGMCEQPKECEADKFKCKNGQCIPGIERCRVFSLGYGEGCIDRSHLQGCGENCSYDCSDVDDHVCGSDGRTYRNPCRLNYASCDKGLVITVNAKGMCEQPEDCEADEFKCKNGQCIPGIERCQMLRPGEGCVDMSHTEGCDANMTCVDNCMSKLGLFACERICGFWI